MGRSLCYDKMGLKKGPWTPEEDQKLLAYIEEHGHGSWRALPAKAGLQRCGKSCRLRWTNYLRSDIKRGKFTIQEEKTIIQLHALLGNRWSAIASYLPKRTDNEIKNYWNTHLKKRLTKMGIDPVSHKPKNDTLISSDGQPKSRANLSHMAQWESARLEAEVRLVKQSQFRCTSQNEKQVQLVEPSLGSNKLNAPASCAPTRSLDLLKAWNMVWDNKHHIAIGGNGIGDFESPTSTHSSSNFVGGNSSKSCDDGTKFEEFEEEWEFKDENQMANSIQVFTGINMSSTTDNINGHSNDDSNNGFEPNQIQKIYYEDNNKNYWNNILNLVNSSLHDPPLF